jgi:hypothetical protein
MREIGHPCLQVSRFEASANRDWPGAALNEHEPEIEERTLVVTTLPNGDRESRLLA